MQEKVQQALDSLLSLFESGDVPQAISISLLPRFDVPSNKWSLGNRLLMFLSGTSDARGFRQWELAGRNVRKGSKALHIICPKIVKKKNAKGEEESILIGFAAVPVFKFENTDGEPLQVEELPPLQLPPLYDVARKWGIETKYQKFQGWEYGSYSSSRKQIVLHTHDSSIFLHELAHSAHQKVVGNLTHVQKWRREVVAELTAAVLGKIYTTHFRCGNHYQYIRTYAQEGGMDVYRACMSVVQEVGKCVNLILKAESEEVKAVA